MSTRCDRRTGRAPLSQCRFRSCDTTAAVLFTLRMKTTLSVAEAQTQLARLVRGKETISLRQRDETVAFLVPRERMEALLETMEILSNPAAMRALKQIWGESTADTLSYMDVDLSTDLRAFAPTGSGTAASIAALD